MKFWKLTLLSICSFFAVSATVLLTACEKDACTELKCKNSSACTEGFCRCQTGYEGAECEIKTSSRFVGTYYGFNHCDDEPPILDTVDVYEVADPNVLEFGLRASWGRDKFRGTADGYQIIVGDDNSAGPLRKVSAVLERVGQNDQLTVLVQRSAESGSPSNKTVCTFVGLRQ